MVQQRISLRDFLVYKMTWSGYAIKTKGSILFWLKTKQDHDVADNEKLTNIEAAPTGKTREYTSVHGANVTVRELEEADAKPDFSKEDFLKALKQGKTWTLNRFSKVRCFQCNGSG